MKIKILRERNICFDEDEYTVDLDRRMDPYTPGDLICYVSPFFPGIPLRLSIAIRADGSLAFRSWSFSEGGNHYLHTSELPASACQNSVYSSHFTATSEQIDTVNGLFSGRIRFEGLKLAVGATVQDICPIDIQREEELVGHRIYLA